MDPALSRWPWCGAGSADERAWSCDRFCPEALRCSSATGTRSTPAIFGAVLERRAEHVPQRDHLLRVIGHEEPCEGAQRRQAGITGHDLAILARRRPANSASGLGLCPGGWFRHIGVGQRRPRIVQFRGGRSARRRAKDDAASSDGSVRRDLPLRPVLSRSVSPLCEGANSVPDLLARPTGRRHAHLGIDRLHTVTATTCGQCGDVRR